MSGPWARGAAPSRPEASPSPLWGSVPDPTGPGHRAAWASGVRDTEQLVLSVDLPSSLWLG